MLMEAANMMMSRTRWKFLNNERNLGKPHSTFIQAYQLSLHPKKLALDNNFSFSPNYQQNPPWNRHYVANSSWIIFQSSMFFQGLTVGFRDDFPAAPPSSASGYPSRPAKPQRRISRCCCNKRCLENSQPPCYKSEWWWISKIDNKIDKQQVNIFIWLLSILIIFSKLNCRNRDILENKCLLFFQDGNTPVCNWSCVKRHISQLIVFGDQHCHWLQW